MWNEAMRRGERRMPRRDERKKVGSDEGKIPRSDILRLLHPDLLRSYLLIVKTLASECNESTKVDFGRRISSKQLL